MVLSFSQDGDRVQHHITQKDNLPMTDEEVISEIDTPGSYSNLLSLHSLVVL